MLHVGDKAPLDILVLDEEGREVGLESLLGSRVVLYFYPKDNTPGCTEEACNFRDVNKELQNMGAVVIGVSTDSVRSHNNFKEKHRLNFALWSDPEHRLIEAFGAWKEKKMFGKSYMGIVRSTFVIDEKGVIEKVWERVNPKIHDQEVLESFKDR